MKNFLLLLGVLGVFFTASCNSQSNSAGSAAVAQDNKAQFLKMKGDWVIASIDYEKGYKIKPFDQGANAQCFVGSRWKLVPNNYTGSYTIDGSDGCPSVSQPIKFEVVDGNTFQFKKIISGMKPKDNVVGYTLTLVSQTDNQFSLQQTIPFEGDNVKVVYNFTRAAAN